MPLIAGGLYIDCGDKAYEAETTYYLNFHILSALASKERLLSFENQFIWENKCQYYHYYCDHLLFSIGQISNRFIVRKKDKTIIRERKKLNRMNYHFYENDYPILSNKTARNTIEHIDEYNSDIIENNHGVGGFNLISTDTDVKLIQDLRCNRSIYPYTLDLINNELLIYRNGEDVSVQLDSLHGELLKLQKSVKEFLTYIQ